MKVKLVLGFGMVETGTRVSKLSKAKQNEPNNNKKPNNPTKSQKFASNNSGMNRVRIAKEEQTATV